MPDIIYRSKMIHVLSIISRISNKKVAEIVPLFPHISSKSYFYVPCGKQNIRHGNFYKVFDWSVWLVFFVSWIFSGIIIWLISRSVDNSDESVCYRSISHIFYCSLAVFVSYAVPQMPKSTIIRMLFLTLICFCYATNTVFQSFFTSYLIEPGFNKQISTVTELSDSNITTFTDFSSLTNYRNKFDEHNILNPYYMEVRGVNFIFSNTSVLNFLSTENAALLADEFEMKFTLQSYGYNVETCKFLNSYSLMYSFGSFSYNVYYDILNRRAIQCFEAGLFNYVINNYIPANKIDIKHASEIDGKLKSSINVDYFIYEIRHLKLAFILLICGYLLSFIVFIVEIAYFRRNMFN
ncbi:hypothetical protein L9F63_014970 [Diploptera punctata]|uniref:Ionotropic glutamate receptor C-terminal domain-containing protein n=1 Tax=Diploptera punctata TaxID=6984 RepID=A0AAD8EK27_DIPPU|nr:hypothetical protein L9F63_014970 [Diploptera punctata]